MKIGFVYDTKEDYGYEHGNLDYTDFVSLYTVSQIKRAFELCGYDVCDIGNIEKLKEVLSRGSDEIDLFFNIAEGFGTRNREALVPALLEAYNQPFTASDAYAMSIALNKHQTKLLAQSIGVPCPKGILFNQIDEDIVRQMNEIGFPAVLKPNAEGGSMGLHLVKSPDEALVCIERDSHISGEWLFEQYIKGTEITVPIIGDGLRAKALGVVATVLENGTNIALYGSELKYIDNVINTLDFECPDHIVDKILEYSVAIHHYFGMNDYSRMDFRLDEDFRPYFLEANLMPSLCRGGSFEVCGTKMGLEYHNVIGLIVEAALERQGLIA